MNLQQFLNDIFLGDAKTISFVKRLVGYIASGEKEEQIIPIIYGSGRNGKTTFIEALKGAMGRELRHGGSYVFGQSDGAQARPDLVALRGVKLLAFEGPVCHRDFAMNLKSLASDDQIVARALFESEMIIFRNKATPVLVANEIPQVFFRDKALGERAVVIPCRARIAVPKRNLKFNPAVVRAWIEEGRTSWKANGLKIPTAFRIAAFGKRAA
jgi:putative DNA primase/helicase